MSAHDTRTLSWRDIWQKGEWHLCDSLTRKLSYDVTRECRCQETPEGLFGVLSSCLRGMPRGITPPGGEGRAGGKREGDGGGGVASTSSLSNVSFLPSFFFVPWLLVFVCVLLAGLLFLRLEMSFVWFHFVVSTLWFFYVFCLSSYQSVMMMLTLAYNGSMGMLRIN